ncbi:hypothetical protein, partial [Streptomyces sp. NPDC059814]|uniref:hypothetical protein n=1 Tax=Streptomyces sp. NPDC059814 TaxID=3346959 RepID=UPI00364FF90B
PKTPATTTPTTYHPPAPAAAPHKNQITKNPTDGSGPAGEPGRWTLGAEHVERLSTWIADGASTAGVSPEHAAELLLQALTDDSFQHWIGTRA